MAGNNPTSAGGKGKGKSQAAAPSATKPQTVTTADLDSIKATHVVVRSLLPGFRRAGRAWPTEETVVPLEELSESDLDSLLAESNLLVAFVELPNESGSHNEQAGQQ